MATPVPRSTRATAGKPFLISVALFIRKLAGRQGLFLFSRNPRLAGYCHLQQYPFQAFSHVRARYRAESGLRPSADNPG